MANATKTTVEIPQAPIIPPPIKKERIVLELSINEAETLGLVLARASGSPRDSRRRDCDSIRNALSNIGFGWEEITARLGLEKYSFAPAMAPNCFITFNTETLDPSKD